MTVTSERLFSWSRSGRWTAVLGAMLWLLWAGSLAAEEVLPKVQRELRSQRYYFGPIDGRATAETTRAILKFQDARGIDQSGHLDYETLRALGMAQPSDAEVDDVRRLRACCETVLRYWQVRQTGKWPELREFFAPSVNYLFDGIIERTKIETLLAAEDRRWPHRRYTLINRIATLLPDRQAQISARVRSEVATNSQSAPARTEDLIFRLQENGPERRWQITALKLLE